MTAVMSQALNQQIIESSVDGVWVIDANSVTTFVNASMADMLGHQRHELVGRSLFDVLDDAGKLAAQANVARRKDGIAEVHDFTFVHRDGRSVWARMSSSPLYDEDGVYIGAVAFVTDQTEQRRQQAERERLWRILDESLNEIYLFAAGDLRFEYANAAALRNLGYSLEEARELTPVDIKPQFSHSSFADLVAPLLDGSQRRIWFETVHRRRDGTTYPVEAQVQLTGMSPPGFLAFTNDISERLNAERRRAQSEAMFRSLVEQSQDLLLLSDATGKLSFASPSVTAILGYTPEEFLALDSSQLLQPEDLALRAAWLEAPSRHGHQALFEARVRHRDGSWRTLEVRTQNRLDDPDLRALVRTARDVTLERKLQSELVQAQRLESIGRLAGGIAHDFNNILTVILGTAGFLEEDETLGEESRADVQEIKRAGGRASELTNQLLTFARRRIVRPETISLVDIVASQDRFLRRVIGAHIELKTYLPADLWPVFADPAQIEQVIVNLAVNARDAMGEGGKLVIEAANVVLDSTFAAAHPGMKAGRYVRVVVSDSGEGIPADVLPHIFEPFYTTKAAGAGTGLGLATVYGIVHQCNGHVWVYSESGVGTTFKLYFPEADRGAGEVVPEPVPPLRPGTETVLVVEDEDAVRQMIVRVLDGAGYQVHAAAGPQAALEWARQAQGRFDLLLTDIVMPGMSGKQLATLLVELYPHLQVLYVSGYTENTIVHRGVLEQGVEFLAKPFSPDELRIYVRQVLDRG